MSLAVKLILQEVELVGELDDSPAGKALAPALPLSMSLSRWGQEYYGDLGVSLGPLAGEQVEVLEKGALAFWQPGNALCLFFGPTPASQGQECRAASPVYPLGRVTGDWAAVKALGPQVKATLTAA
ncbi:MAG: hypothetical protein C4525_15555 [Desulfarculus sp.]|nr:MAG: hypothetical protein C4525_15555 [Desulfarculus sp.]